MSWLFRFMRTILFLPPEGSTFAPRADQLHFIIIAVTFGMAAFIFAVIFYFIVRYPRKTKHDVTPKVLPKMPFEILIWGVPLTFFVFVFFIGFNDYVFAETPPEDTFDIYVTAKQWMWKFTYPDGPSSIAILHVPAGRNVRLLITSRDVIHSFFVPAFRMKKDAVPGRYTELWFQAPNPGEYPIYCAEYCGLRHSQMWGTVVVMRPAAFQDWMEQQRRGLMQARGAGPSPLEEGDGPADLRDQGRRLAAEKGCLNCHSVDGEPHIGPTWLDLYMRKEKLTSGETVIADGSYITESMMEPAKKIVAGYSPVMPSFQGRITAPEAAAIVEYIKSLRSSDLEHARTEGPAFGPIDSK